MYLTKVVQSRTYVNISTPGFANVRKSCLDGIECPNLAMNELSSSAKGQEGYERTVSISKTVLKAFSDMPAIGARKLPAAPGVLS